MPMSLENRSVNVAMVASPVTLVAVPKESCARYRAIMSAIIDSLKPSIDSSSPIAVITPPPGTPGAATIIMPSISTTGVTEAKLGFCPVMYSTATAHEVMVIIDPDRWMVAHNGIAKSTTRDAIPAFLAERTVTGIVAAEDWVPIAVKYAGSMVLSIFAGLRLETAPAAVY